MRGAGPPTAAFGLALALLAAPFSPAAASGVAVQLQGSPKPVVVSTDQIGGLADVPATRYRLRERAGVPPRTVTRSGTRLATVLRAAGVDPASVPTLEIARDDGSILYLPRHQIDPSAGAPPLLYLSGRAVGFVRDSTGSDDLNARDAFTSSSGTPIRMTVSPTAMLTVQIRSSETRIRPGASVRLQSEVAGAMPGEGLVYEWRFGDGATAATAETTHRFRHRGRYEVVLRVTGEGQSGGSSAPLTIQVGPPEERGPEREGAGRSNAEAAPQVGPLDGSETGGGSAGPAVTAPPEQNTPPAARRTARKDSPRRRPPGRFVRGTALGGPSAPRRTGVVPPAARTGSGGGELRLGWIAGAGICLTLLVLGAGSEWRALGERRRRVLGAGGRTP